MRRSIWRILLVAALVSQATGFTQFVHKRTAHSDEFSCAAGCGTSADQSSKHQPGADKPGSSDRSHHKSDCATCFILALNSAPPLQVESALFIAAPALNLAAAPGSRLVERGRVANLGPRAPPIAAS